MAGELDVIVRFLGDSSRLRDDVAKVEGTGNKLKSWAKGVGAAIGAAFVVKEVKDFVSAAEDAERVSARLAQTMKNAGDETGAWTKHAEALATTLMKKTGIDDETIKSGQAVLSTFHAVNNATTQQNGLFDEATRLAVDLSKSGFPSVEAAAKALGKGLNDPLGGMGALSRAGVKLTEDQKNLVGAFLFVGDTASAQGVVLDAVKDKVGGVAEKTATAGDKMKVAWGEAQESIGKALIPAIEAILPAIQKVAGWIEQHPDLFAGMAAGILAVGAAFKIAALAAAAFDVAAAPITLVALAVMVVVAAVVILAVKWDEVWSWISDAPWYVKVAAAILLLVNPMLVIIVTAAYVLSHWQEIWQGIQDAVNVAIAFIVGLWNGFIGFVSRIPGLVAGALSTIYNVIVGAFQSALDWLGRIPGWIADQFAKVPGLITGALSGVWDAITSPFRSAWDEVQRIAGWIGDAIDTVTGAWNHVARTLNSVHIHIDIPSVDLPIVGEIGGGSFNLDLPHVPELAKGGIVTAPTLALIGERGAEAVVPLSRFGSNRYDITVNVAPGVSPAEVGAATVDAIRQYERVAGKAWRE